MAPSAGPVAPPGAGRGDGAGFSLGARCRAAAIAAPWSRDRAGTGRHPHRHQVSQGLPTELLLPEPHELDEAVGGGLCVGEGEMGLPVGDRQPFAKSFQADRVPQLEEESGHAGGVEVVVRWGSVHRPRDEPGVERVRAVFHQDRPLGELAEAERHSPQRGGPGQHRAADPMDPAGVGIDVIGGVDQAL